MTCGIYNIKNTTNGKLYIGSSQDIEKRWRRHVRDLKNGSHHNVYLQRAWDKYGEKAFKLVIVKTCYRKTLIRREQKILDELFHTGQLYNISSCASGGDILSNHPRRDEIVNKIASNTRELAGNLSEQERKDKWAKYGEDNPNYGNKWSLQQRKAASERMKKRFRSPEERKKISEARKKYFSNPDNRAKMSKAKSAETRAKMSKAKSAETRAKMSEFAKTRIKDKNPFYGRKHSEETKQKIRDAKAGKYNGNQERRVIADGIKYKSVSHAARNIGVCPATIIFRIKSDNPKFSEYYYIGDLK